MNEDLKVIIEMNPVEARAVAQFIKRVSFETCLRHADAKCAEEPYDMLNGLGAIRRALAEAGIAPR